MAVEVAFDFSTEVAVENFLLQATSIEVALESLQLNWSPKLTFGGAVVSMKSWQTYKKSKCVTAIATRKSHLYRGAFIEMALEGFLIKWLYSWPLLFTVELD